MAEQKNSKTLKSRLIQKHEYEADWNNAVNFIPLEAEIVVYDAEADQNGNLFEGVTLPEGRTIPYTYARIKIGDGVTKVKDLPFVDDGKPGEITITGANYGQSDYAEVCGERFNDYEGNKALAAGSHAEGVRSIDYDGTKQTIIYNVAGCGCFEIDSKSILNGYYYYPNFNITNKTIIVKGDASAYAAGDVISVITDTNFDECATIASVAYNGSDKTVITLQEWPKGLVQGSSSLILDFDNAVKSYTPMTLRVVAKPLIGTTFLGLGAHTEGLGSRALADGAHAEGRETQAVGRYGHTEGRETKAHYAAHAEGWKTQATGDYAHAEGKDTIASGYTAHVEGDTTSATGGNAHAEGYSTIASGNKSHAEGNMTRATAAATHAEGDQTQATASGAHAEGYKTQATANMSHAEGDNTIASGKTSHAEGSWTVASHEGSHAGGYATQTGFHYQSVIGIYNEGKDNTLFEVGNGTKSDGGVTTRRNAFEIYTDGHAEVQKMGDTTNSVVTKSALDTAVDKKPGLKVSGGEVFNDTANNKATGGYAHAEGLANEATGYTAHAEGNATKASGTNSHTEGYNNKAIGAQSHAEGRGTIAGEVKEDGTIAGTASHAEGNNTKALAYCTHAEGNETTASGQYAHVEGYDNIASGESSHAEGFGTVASGNGSHAEGSDTTASGEYSHAEGNQTIASGGCSHAEGVVNKVFGDYAHAEGADNEVSGSGAHAEGVSNNVSGTNAHAEGSSNEVSGPVGHAEGVDNKVTGEVGHAEGGNNTVSGNYAHVEGSFNTVSGYAAHAEGDNTIASGYAAHTSGSNTIARYDNQFVLGKFNDNKNNTLFEVGNGVNKIVYKPIIINSNDNITTKNGVFYYNDSPLYIDEQGKQPFTTDKELYFPIDVYVANYDRKNAFEVYEDGHAEIQIMGDTDTSVATRKYVDDKLDDRDLSNYYTKNETDTKIATKPGVKTAEGGETFNSSSNIATGLSSHAEGSGTQATAFNAHAEGSQSKAYGSSSHAEGYKTEASGESAHAEGETTQAIGKDSHAEGRNTQAGEKLADNSIIGTTAHAEGNDTRATAYASHSEGSGTRATGQYSHTEGLNTKAKGIASHAEGQESRVESDAAHAEGNKTVAGIRGYKVLGIRPRETETDTLCTFIIEATNDLTVGTMCRANLNGELSVNEFSINLLDIDLESGYFVAETSEIFTDKHASVDFSNPETICYLYFGDGTIGFSLFGNYSHAEGDQSRALGSRSHAEGNKTLATALGAHAEGDQTQATTTGAHAEGYLTKASGKLSHAEGRQTVASGYASHSEGNGTLASGTTSHAEGYNTIASGILSHAEGNATKAVGEDSHAEGRQSKAGHLASHAEGYKSLAGLKGAFRIIDIFYDNGICLYQLHSTQGLQVGDTYQLFRDNTLVDSINTIVSINHANNTITTNETWLEDLHTELMAPYTHSSEPFLIINTASNQDMGKYAHAEGIETRAMGNGAHAEGKETWAVGNYSHTSGVGTIAKGEAQTVIGTYNQLDENALFVVGNGTNAEEINRTNAFTVNKDGSATISKQGNEDMSIATKQYVDSHAGGGSGNNVIVDGTPVYGASIYIQPNQPTELKLGDIWIVPLV